MGASADGFKPYMPLAGLASDGYSDNNEATATCYCGAVQLAFPTCGPALLGTFVCHCTDCRKITASMFTSSFIIAEPHLKHLRGRDNLSTFTQSHTVRSGQDMTNYFCSTCGSLMYRVGASWPGGYFLRIGTVDDFTLHETRLKPTTEVNIQSRVAWLKPVEGMEQVEGNSMTPTQ